MKTKTLLVLAALGTLYFVLSSQRLPTDPGVQPVTSGHGVALAPTGLTVRPRPNPREVGWRRRQ